MRSKDLPPNWDSYFAAPMFLVLIAFIFPTTVLMTVLGMIGASGHPVFIASYLVVLSLPFIFLIPLFYYGLLTYGAVDSLFPLSDSPEGRWDAALKDLATLLVEGLGDARRTRLGRFERLLFTNDFAIQLGDDPSARLFLFRTRVPSVSILLTRAARGRAADVNRVMRPVTSPGWFERFYKGSE